MDLKKIFALSTVVLLGLALFAFTNNEEVSAESAPTLYQERACTVIINNKGVAGMECHAAVGGTCRKAKECTPLDAMPNGGAERFFTEEDLANWPNVEFSKEFTDYLVKIGWREK